MKRVVSVTVAVFVVFLSALTLGGCGGPKQALTEWFPEYALAESGLTAQTKSSVTITVTPLSQTQMYEHPEFFQFDKARVPEALVKDYMYCPQYKLDPSGRFWCYTFGAGSEQLAAFTAEIRNGTDHILRMKDSRIYLEVEGQDPVPATTDHESLVRWMTSFEEKAEAARPKQVLLDRYYRYPVGLAGEVVKQNRAAYKLIASAETEILPGKALKGILLFPVTVSFSTATLTFYDIHTKTDPAGNPIEKQTFSFPLKLERTQMQWNGKQWVKVVPSP